MDVTKKKKFGLEKNVFSTIWQDLFGFFNMGPFAGRLLLRNRIYHLVYLVDYTIILGLFNGDSGIFFWSDWIIIWVVQLPLENNSLIS